MVNIQVRVDEHLRDQAQQILSQIGMDMTTALTSSRQAQNLNIIDILSAIKDGDSLLSPYAFSGAWGSLRMGSCC